MKISPPAMRYRLLSGMLLPFWLFHALWMALKNHQIDYFRRRLGWQMISSDHCVWLHASSVGEVELIRPLVELLINNNNILITTFTPTGYQQAKRIMPENASIEVLPIDCWWLSRRFIQRSCIKLAIIAETELWPETLYQVKKRHIPLLSINSRLSARSLESASWSRQILVQTLSYFDHFITRSERDLDHLKSMQVSSNSIKICGNLKLAPKQDQQDYPDLIGRPYILFASTHSPEEAEFAQMFKELDSDILCVIAPRHPQRAKDIMPILTSVSPYVSQRSKAHPIQKQTEIYLADTLGELKALMQHATLVVMGGSFHQIGGHNVLEPASLGKAVITGPSDSNIRNDIELLVEHDAIRQVGDFSELKQCLQTFLQQPQTLLNLSQNARTVMQKQQHILNCYYETIQHYL